MRLMAALIVLTAQVGIAGAGVLDGHKGASAASHLESGGTNLHFAHNEATCFMCRAQHMGDAVPFSIEPPPSVPVMLENDLARSIRIAAAAQHVSNATRAPPAAV